MVDWSPIKREIIEGVDFMLIRENCGGAYYGNKVMILSPSICGASTYDIRSKKKIMHATLGSIADQRLSVSLVLLVL